MWYSLSQVLITISGHVHERKKERDGKRESRRERTFLPEKIDKQFITMNAK